MHIELITRTPRHAPTSQPPIVCVHGGYHGAWCWDEHFLPFFAEQGFEAHALSLRGHGQSDGHAPINRWRLADYVTDLMNVIASLRQPPILIGHSLGGVVVQKYLERHPARGGILLASSPIQGMLRVSLAMLARHPLPVLKMFVTQNMLHARPAFERIFFSASMPPAQVQAYVARMGNESFRAFLDIAGLDRPRPTRVTTPMLVIGGADDRSIPRAINQALAAAYHTELEEFPVAHDIMLEANWRLVAARIVAWIHTR
jgi:pimeloyl-ACP methyl ester carboxylesterase